MAESEARWYVVHTYSGYENKVATDLMTTAENRNLQDMIIDVKVPVEIVTETVGDKTKEVENKLFPGYVFVKMVYTDETWYVVRNIRGCTGFVGPGSKAPYHHKMRKFTEWVLKHEALSLTILSATQFAL